ncbi:hypothetical protein PG997_007034 [Apiospora hydei]|uniref:Uncharacterized protein n=1 Tax=Apiospora hydei TaxID=1337664 RepID=A0ABR1WQR0_9PEZI
MCPGSGEVGIPHIPYENIELPDDEYSDLEQYHSPEPIAIDNTSSNHESDEEVAYRASNSITVNLSLRQRSRRDNTINDNNNNDDDNLFLVKFVHTNCPGPTRGYKEADIDAAARRRRARFRELLREAFEFGDGADRALRQEHEGGKKTVTVPETGETATSFYKARVTSVHVHWAGQGVGSNLFTMEGVKTVQRQLRMVRLRGQRDWVEVRYETLEHVHVYPAESENEGKVGGESRDSDTDKSLDREPEKEEEEESSSGNGNGNGGGGGSVDAEMNSPPPATATCPSSSHGYDDEECNDIEQMPLYSMTLHDGASGAGVKQQQQQEQQQGDESSQEIPAPDSQGLIW